MKISELIDLLRFCADEETICVGCKRFDFKCGDWDCVAELLFTAADALEARNAGDALVPGWMPVKFMMPPMKTVKIEDDEDPIEYQESDTVIVYTTEGCIVEAKAAIENGKVYWYNVDGAEYDVTHWMAVKPPRRYSYEQRRFGIKLEDLKA